MSIFAIMRADNEKTLKLIRKLEETSVEEPGERAELIEDARVQIESLGQAEDSILYARLAVEDALDHGREPHSSGPPGRGTGAWHLDCTRWRQEATMAQPRTATTIKQWMAHLAEAACDGRVAETSAGAGPDHDFAYLHFRTAEGGHSALVMRAVLVDGHPEIRVLQVEAGPEQISKLVDAATHGQAARQA